MTDRQEEFGVTRSSRAFQAFRHAIEEGSLTEFLLMASDDLRFAVPMPFVEWKGMQYGKKRFEELVLMEREALAVRLTSLLELEDANHGIVVFSAEGTLNGAPYSNELTIVFEFENERIRSFREYVGSTQYMLSAE
ncbi:nuclear transport factor 2 family protein [Paenibacillus sepulcri]|uniref:Nuclear transport factor 2 family protein n=1 Tax=Paenibacillus sepulcri TaxID=359917 RepID=A0ABS7BZD7_9BACL|nr:nuclear transport factor 2 family protein [Paenibacillus sepulcri]